MNVVEYVKRIFEDPEMEDDLATCILWNCTGYPSFYDGDPIRCLTRQLRHARRSLDRGFTIDQIAKGEDELKPNNL